MPTAPANVLIVAGEASGDLHGARVAQALKHIYPKIWLRAMGSDKLRDAGVRLLFDCKEIAVVGLVEVLLHWPEIRRALKTIEQALHKSPPDLLLLIDYVEFNLRIAAVAKRLGIKVLFYISPQIWAWRPERIHKIGSVVDMMAVIFPFEVDYYRRAGIPVRYVGHPLAGSVAASCSRESLLRELAIGTDKRLIGLLPGSRNSEIRCILPTLLATARRLNRQRNDLVFLLPVAPTLSRNKIEQHVQRAAIGNIIVLEKRAYDVMHCADSILIASGTATLEAAMIGVPMAVVYRVSALSWLWMKRKLQIPQVGLVNIVAGGAIVPEFIQGRCRPDLLCAELNRQLDDVDYREAMCARQRQVTALLGERDAAAGVATLVAEMLAD